MNNSVGVEKHYLFRSTNLLDLRIKFIKEFFKENKITDVGSSSMRDVMLKLLIGYYNIGYVIIGKCLASVLEISSDLLRKVETTRLSGESFKCVNHAARLGVHTCFCFSLLFM